MRLLPEFVLTSLSGCQFTPGFSGLKQPASVLILAGWHSGCGSLGPSRGSVRVPSKLVLVAADRPQEGILQAHSGGCWSHGPLLRLPSVLRGLRVPRQSPSLPVSPLGGAIPLCLLGSVC